MSEAELPKRLEVVGPKHERYKIKGTVRLKTRHQVSSAVLVIPSMGSSLTVVLPGKPSSITRYSSPSFLPEHPGPAHVLSEPLLVSGQKPQVFESP